jgi:hypothetical protein
LPPNFRRSGLRPIIVAAPRTFTGANTLLEHYPRSLAVTIRNRNTRQAYLHAVRRFFAWCERERIGQLVDIEPLHVAALISKMNLSR